MFEWLQGTTIYGRDEYIGGYNQETKKFIIEDEEGTEIKQVNIFDTGIVYNIDYYNNWQEKLYNGLIKNGRIDISILSTESGDNYDLEIYRHKTLLPTNEFAEEIILTAYVIVCNGEVKGKSLIRHAKHYSGCAIDEQKEFSEWIEEQIEEVSDFNNSEFWNSFDSIVCSDCLCTQEEYGVLWDMFNEKTV